MPKKKQAIKIFQDMAEIAVKIGILKGKIQQLEKENERLRRDYNRALELIAENAEGAEDGQG